MIQRITIIGVGLIGGSLAAVWKTKRRDLHLTGCDSEEVLRTALEASLIDEAAPSPETAVLGADLVVLATPIGAMSGILDAMAPVLAPGTLVTDVGSVKSPVVTHAQRVLAPENPFIGGHPMAGSERSGVGYADPFLFENATYVLCPPQSEDPGLFLRGYRELVDLIQLTGANLLLLDPLRHDRIAAAVSHVPQLVAVALMNSASDQNERDSAFLRLAAGGFRDMTRIAASSFDVWDDILIANQGPIDDALHNLIDRLATQRQNLQSEHAETLGEEFRKARASRRSIPRDMRGFLSPLSDIYVYAKDQPGFLFHLTHHVYDADLNIKDIELIKMREGTGGAFRLGFSDDEHANRAVDVLTGHGYTAYRL